MEIIQIRAEVNKILKSKRKKTAKANAGSLKGQ